MTAREAAFFVIGWVAALACVVGLMVVTGRL